MEQLVSTVQSWLPLVVVFLPLLIGLLTKSTLSEKGKAVTMLVLTGVAALANQVDANAGILTVEMLGAWGLSVVVTISTYYGVWKPLGAGNIAPKVGIGPVTDYDVPDQV